MMFGIWRLQQTVHAPIDFRAHMRLSHSLFGMWACLGEQRDRLLRREAAQQLLLQVLLRVRRRLALAGLSHVAAAALRE